MKTHAAKNVFGEITVAQWRGFSQSASVRVRKTMPTWQSISTSDYTQRKAITST